MSRKLLGLSVVAVLVIVASVGCAAAPNVVNLGAKQAAPAASPQPVNADRAATARESAAAPSVGTSADARGVDVQSQALSQAQAQSQTFDRMVIRTAQISLEVTDMEQALSQVRQIAQQGGGIVSASNTRVERIDDQERTIADLTIQVRGDGAEAALSALRGLGKVTTETSASQDVTEEYVDLDSNLRNLQASEAAVIRLMDRAQRIEDVVALQRELSNIRGQIERIQGRKRYLERRTDMATITLSLRLPPVESARPLGGSAWNPFALAARGWQASLTVLRGIAEVLILVVSFSWWLAPLGVLAWYVWQQRRRTRPTPAAASTPTDA
jgi:Domain of unknown function (DUF4349)